MSWLEPKALDWLAVGFDRDLDRDNVHDLTVSLLATHNLAPVVIETEQRKGGTVFRVGSRQPDRVAQLMRTFVPSATVEPSTRTIADRGSAWIVKSNTYRRAINSTTTEATSARLLGALCVEGAIHQLVIGRRLRPVAIPSDASGWRSEQPIASFFEALWSGVQPFDSELRRAIAAKQAEPGAYVSMRLLVPGDRQRSIGAVANYGAALRSLESPGLRLRLIRENWRAARNARPAWLRRLSLNSSELTAVLAWPYGSRSYHGVERTRHRELPTPKATAGRTIGVGTHPSTRRPVGIAPTDGLRHMWAMGPTGVGKSTMLEHLALQDIRSGRGALVIDPKGDLVEGILARVKKADLERIVVLDASRSDQVVGFNPLAVRPSEIELAVDGVLHVLRSLNSESWGPRTQDIVHAGLLTLARSERPSLVALPQLLVDERFRRTLVGNQLPAPLRGFWSWYDNLSQAEQASVTAPVLNKTRPFTLRTSLRAMLGQPQPSFDPATIFTERKVLLVPLHKGQLGSETANLIGALVISRIWQITQARSAMPADQRHPVFAYLDEFQDYLRLPTDFADILAQARGLGLGLVLAHQHLRQLNDSVRAAVTANAQNSVMFRLGGSDAEALAKTTRQLDADDFTALPAYTAYARLLVDGQLHDFGSLRTVPPREAVRDGRAAADRIAKRWGTDPRSIDAALYETGPPGRRRSGSDDTPIGVKQRGPR